MQTRPSSRIRGSLLLAALAIAPVAASAQEETLIAGWDFSQYALLDILSLDGATLNGDTIDPNHSDLDPTNQCGIESNAFGRMYFDGSFGSSVAILDPNVAVLDAFRPFAASEGAGSLLSNVDQAFLGYGSGAACTQGQIENMPFANCNDFAMIATGAVSIVFAADRSEAPGVTGDWLVAFAGRTLSGGSTQVGVQFSGDGAGYSNAGTATVTGVDEKFTFPLGGAESTTAYVRLTFTTPAPGGEVLIDNFGIAVPEPAHGALAGVLALLGLRWTRRRR